MEFLEKDLEQDRMRCVAAFLKHKPTGFWEFCDKHPTYHENKLVVEELLRARVEKVNFVENSNSDSSAEILNTDIGEYTVLYKEPLCGITDAMRLAVLRELAKDVSSAKVANVSLWLTRRANELEIEMAGERG